MILTVDAELSTAKFWSRKKRPKDTTIMLTFGMAGFYSQPILTKY